MEKLSEKDKGLIRDSWESLGKNKLPHGIVMFTRLFELDPALLTLFSYSTNCGVAPECLSSPAFLEHVTKAAWQDLVSRSQILRMSAEGLQTLATLNGQGLPKKPYDLQVMLVIDAAVSHLDDLHTLEDFLLNLGRKHQAVGVKTQSFTMVGESLLYMLQSSLGPAYTTPLRQAWLNMYSIVVSAMTRGWAKNGEHKSN